MFGKLLDHALGRHFMPSDGKARHGQPGFQCSMVEIVGFQLRSA